MAKHRDSLLKSLREAVNTYDADRVTELTGSLVSELRQEIVLDPAVLVAALEEATRAKDGNRVEAISVELAEMLRREIARSPSAFVIALGKAADAFDREAAAELCEKLISFLRASDEPYPEKEAKQILGELRRKRYFDLMIEVADVLIQSGQCAPVVQRQHAQALLDEGRISAGLAVLHDLEKECRKGKNANELAEAVGLIGRAHKQAYIDAGQDQPPGKAIQSEIVSAIAAYAGVYKKTEKIWHGINTVALLKRAERDGVPVANSHGDANAISKTILNSIEARKRSRKKDQQADLWDFATAGEACLALGEYGKALEWILEYTNEEAAAKWGADAFEYASTLRQFEEVWQLDSADPAQAKILHVLREALLRSEGGELNIVDAAKEIASAAELAADKNFEKVLGEDRYKTFQWYKMGLDRAQGVAKIVNRVGTAQGTGFLVRGSDIHPGITDEWVLLTNAHVVSDDPNEQAAIPSSLPSDDARIRFEARPGSIQEYRVAELVFTSPRTELDCTVLRLTPAPKLDEPFPISKYPPRLDGKQRVYVIGHPRGGGLSFSIHDNKLLNFVEPKVHYRAPTEGGSSGSPVFTQSWDLLALHHAGSLEMGKLGGEPGTYPANEGIYFQSILKAINAAVR
jgi:hypothetical protein